MDWEGGEKVGSVTAVSKGLMQNSPWAINNLKAYDF